MNASLYDRGADRLGRMGNADDSESKPKRKRLPRIGWREWVGLPELGIDRIKAKIDTGARSSSLHAFGLETYTTDAGLHMVHLRVHPNQRDTTTTVEAAAEITDIRWIRPSSGKRQRRPVIVTHVVVAGERFPVELTLANRDAMGFRMLLGREALRRRFLVDPARSYLTERK